MLKIMRKALTVARHVLPTILFVLDVGSFVLARAAKRSHRYKHTY